jgi:hypothetical protein
MRKEVRMKKGIILTAILLLVCLLTLPVGANAYTISDSPSDAIGERVFESYGINVIDPYTHMFLELYTNYPMEGITIAGWETKPADVFIKEYYNGSWYDWAIPLVAHDGFQAGGFYKVKSYVTSDQEDPSGGTGYIFNHNVPVLLKEAEGGPLALGSVKWEQSGGVDPDWKIIVDTMVLEDDPNGYFLISWGTATCANDVVNGSTAPVPEPATMLLLASGLVGLAGFRRRFRKN